jgi:hypothetical protein
VHLRALSGVNKFSQKLKAPSFDEAFVENFGGDLTLPSRWFGTVPSAMLFVVSQKQ